MNIISKTNLWLTLSAILIISSIALLATFGLRQNIDFTGGSLLEVNYKVDRPEINDIHNSLDESSLGSINIQPIGASGIILRMQDINEEQHQNILSSLRAAATSQDMTLPEEQATSTTESINSEAVVASSTEASTIVDNSGETVIDNANNNILEELRFDSVGPSIGAELREKSLYAAIIVLILIVAFIAYSFRKVSKPVASWKYGIAAIVALAHDVLVVLGVFALLGRFLGVEIDTSFVAAVLTVLGYSVNDTIVVFDRVRENLPRSDKDFAATVNDSLNQTIGRSINTSFTTLLVLLALLFWGGDTIHYFVLALVIGIISGTYSSIFLASPLVVFWEKHQ